MDQKPKVGIGVMILKDGKVLLHKRKGSFGSGEYAFPGGHLEYMESPKECAERETKEECGVEIANIRFQFAANIRKYAPRHYIHIGVVADWKSGEPENLEPEKGGEWEWYNLDKLPQPIFEMSKLGIDSMMTGKKYFDL